MPDAKKGPRENMFSTEDRRFQLLFSNHEVDPNTRHPELDKPVFGDITYAQIIAQYKDLFPDKEKLSTDEIDRIMKTYVEGGSQLSGRNPRAQDFFRAIAVFVDNRKREQD